MTRYPTGPTQLFSILTPMLPNVKRKTNAVQESSTESLPVCQQPKSCKGVRKKNSEGKKTSLQSEKKED